MCKSLQMDKISLESRSLSTAEYPGPRARQSANAELSDCVLFWWSGLWGALRRSPALPDRPGPVTLVPLLVSAATFEINFFVHTGVERIGRYIQVFYEERDGSRADGKRPR